MYPKLQYIANAKTATQQLENIQQALAQGIRWIQLRCKGWPETEFLHLAQQVSKLKEVYKFTFIINDNPLIAHSVDADGIHLGLTDMAVKEARAIIGKDKIIGGTANTYSDVLQRIVEQVDYIGLGPLRFTASKAKLSPVLGFAGYAQIIAQLKLTAYPALFAIGGITLADIAELQKIGLYGVALSKEIENNLFNKTNLNPIITSIYEQLNHS